MGTVLDSHFLYGEFIENKLKLYRRSRNMKIGKKASLIALIGICTSLISYPSMAEEVEGDFLDKELTRRGYRVQKHDIVSNNKTYEKAFSSKRVRQSQRPKNEQVDLAMVENAKKSRPLAKRQVRRR